MDPGPAKPLIINALFPQREQHDGTARKYGGVIPADLAALTPLAACAHPPALIIRRACSKARIALQITLRDWPQGCAIRR